MSSMWARIAGGAVAEIVTLDPAGRYHASLSWVPCPLGTQEGDLYGAGTFIRPAPPGAPAPPAAPTLTELQTQLAAIAAEIARMSQP